MTVIAVNSPSVSPMATACPFCVSGIVTESTRTAMQIQYVCGECHRRWFEAAERPWYPSAATKISEAP
jgi:transposase-like protein